MSLPKRFIPPKIFFDSPLVNQVVQERAFASGPFQALFSDYLQSTLKFPHVLLTQNCYSSLVLCLLALSPASPYIIIPSVCTCFSIYNAVIAAGLIPLPCPIDPRTFSYCCHSLGILVREYRPTVAIAVSFFGIPADISSCQELGLFVIEDAAQAFFTRLSLQSSAPVIVLSFGITKQLSCLGGGAILTSSSALSSSLSQAFAVEPSSFLSDHRYPYFPMSNLNAAIALQRVSSLGMLLSRFKNLKQAYFDQINDSSLYPMAFTHPDVFPSRFVVSISSTHQHCLSFEYYRELVSVIPTEQGPSWLDSLISLPFFSDLAEDQVASVCHDINCTHS